MAHNKLSPEEQEILDSYERGEWETVPNLKNEIKRHQDYASNTLRKNQRINIRISSKDLNEIKAIAIEEGIPYQTLISSILHKYASGRIKEI